MIGSSDLQARKRVSPPILQRHVADLLQSGKMIPSHTASPSVPERSGRNGPQVTDFTVHTPDSKARPSVDEPGPSRWRSKEFTIYGVIFALVVPVMIYWPTRLSSRELMKGRKRGNILLGSPGLIDVAVHPNWGDYSHRLTPGWLFGRPVVSWSLEERLVWLQLRL
jgi:hypothetical protein